jgi:predicted nucleotidyltransferase
MDAADVRRTLQAHREILQQYGVQEVRVFGSAVRGEAGEGSDIDLLVDYDPSVRVGLFAFVRLRRRLSRRQPPAHPADVFGAEATRREGRG